MMEVNFVHSSIIIDLPFIPKFTLAVQGRNDDSPWHAGAGDQWVTHFKVGYWFSNETKSKNNLKSVDNGRAFKVDERIDHKKYSNFVFFREPIFARYLKILITGWHNHISMRVGVLSDEIYDDCDIENLG